MNKNGVKIYIEVIGEHLKKNEPGSRIERAGEAIPAIEHIGGLERSNTFSRDGFGKGNRRSCF